MVKVNMGQEARKCNGMGRLAVTGTGQLDSCSKGDDDLNFWLAVAAAGVEGGWSFVLHHLLPSFLLSKARQNSGEVTGRGCWEEVRTQECHMLSSSSAPGRLSCSSVFVGPGDYDHGAWGPVFSQEVRRLEEKPNGPEPGDVGSGCPQELCAHVGGSGSRLHGCPEQACQAAERWNFLRGHQR